MLEHMCELVYSTGGHGGPYPKDEAYAAAVRLIRGNRHERWIGIVPRSAESYIVENADRIVTRDEALQPEYHI